MIKNGTIPENITIASNGKTKPYRNCEDLGNEEEEFFVIPAYAVDSSSEKMVESAKKWATNRSYYNNETRTYTRYNELKIEEIKNTPISGLKILGLEQAYKVVTAEGYYFDLREEVLLDTILNEGISKGGVLAGSFVWGKIGSQMKLVRVGSKLHKALDESTARHALKRIGEKELKVGGLYESKTGNKAIFLGWVSTIEIQSQYENRGYNNTSYSFYSKEVPKAMLFLEFYRYGNETPRERFSKWIIDGSGSCHEKIRTSHTYVKEIEVFTVPSNIIDMVVDNAIRVTQEYYNRFNNSQTQRFRDMCYFSHTINLVPFGKTLRIHPVFNGINLTRKNE